MQETLPRRQRWRPATYERFKTLRRRATVCRGTDISGVDWFDEVLRAGLKIIELELAKDVSKK